MFARLSFALWAMLAVCLFGGTAVAQFVATPPGGPVGEEAEGDIRFPLATPVNPRSPGVGPSAADGSAGGMEMPPEPPPIGAYALGVTESVTAEGETEEDSEEDPRGEEKEEDKEEGEDSLEERLKEIEEDWKKFQEEEKKKKEEADEKKAEDAKKPTFEIGGRVHLDYWNFLENSEGIGYFEHPDEDEPTYGHDPEDRFLFRRIRLEMSGDVPDRMFWRIQLDFNEPATPQMKDVYLGWYLPYNHKLLVGHSKRPLGLDAWESSRYTVFMERPLAVEAFNADARRMGVRMEGYRDDLSASWQYGLFSLEDIQEIGEVKGDSFQPGLYGRLATTPWYDETSNGRGYLHLGLAGAVARPDGDVGDAASNSNAARFRTRPQARTDGRWADTRPIDGAESFEHLGLESVLNIGALQFSGEYLATWLQRERASNMFFHGGYVQAAYFLTGEHMPWERETGQLDRIRPHENFFLVDRCRGGIGSGWGAWQVAARYDYIDLTDGGIRGGVQNDVTLGMNWWWNAHARMQFNVVRGFIDEHRPVGGYESGDFWLAGTRFLIDF